MPASPSSAPAGAGLRCRMASSPSPRHRMAKIRWCTAARRSSAATCGSTPITSTTAIAAPTISVQNGKLAITKTPNGENPLVHGGTPILGCDVWEHSYYIDYRNRRADYLKAFLDHLVNWDYVEELLGAAK